MVKYIFIALLFLFSAVSGVNSQVVSTAPAIPTDVDLTTITFDATQGTAGLKDYTGDVYAHIGVITNLSTDDSNWKYATTWGDNSAKYKLTRISANIYTLQLTPSIRGYFGVPASETIKKVAMVFRSSDGTKEGKDTGGTDIFISVSPAVLSVDITSPNGSSFVQKDGVELAVAVSALFNTDIELYEDGVLLKSVLGQSLAHNYIPASGTHKLLAIAKNSASEIVKDSVVVFVDDMTSPSVALPAGLRQGVNYIDDNSATVTLFAPYKSVVYLIGDFNDWVPTASYKMNKGMDADTAMYWINITGLEKGKEYGYQFLIDNKIRTADPYTNKILDPYDDKWIKPEVYPNLIPYPSAKTNERVSVLQTAQVPYTWKVADFKAPAVEDLVIYELLIRDFQNSTIDGDNQLGYLQQVIDSIGYFKRLGVNAIEIMPFNEFEGNNSWGYNPNYYFATDKAYGTTVKYKEFIDLCHQNGIAVIMDMVLNHAFNSCAFARMYWNDAKGQPAANNPWFNQSAPHTCYNWGSDFNHESVYTQALVDSVNSYWMSEFKIDGFRFDFTKGFTNKNVNCGWDQDNSRIAVLKRMYDEIRERNTDAYVIFEHLTAESEEKILADYGILLWNNINHNYAEATMAYTSGSNSDVSRTSYKVMGFNNPNSIPYMESHDEERQMFKNKSYAAVDGEYNAKDLATSVRRSASASAIYMSIPGPKMIWMFGERGYDVSIDSIDRVAPKPPKWEYMQNPDRLYLFDTYSQLNKLKQAEPVFSTTDFTISVVGALKHVALNMDGSDVRVIANFDTKPVSTQPKFTRTGYWYNHFKGDSVNVKDVNMSVTLGAGEFRIFSEKKMAGFAVNTSIEEEDLFENVKLELFPLPFENVLNLKASSVIGKVEVYSLTGQVLVSSTPDNTQASINTSILPKGLYFVKVMLSDGSSLVRQVLK